MARIQCPGCGKAETLQLQGRFLVTCDDCGRKFIVCIVGQRISEGLGIVCPECGCAARAATGSADLKVTCNLCGHSFIRTATST